MVELTPRGLPPAAFYEVFPFHIWFDDQLKLVALGRVMRRLFPDLEAGAPIFDHFDIVRPRCAKQIEALRDHVRQLFVLAAPATGLRLRGQMLAIDDGSVVFLGSPWVTDAAELTRWGLSVSDFAIHNPMGDQLVLLRSIRSNLDDTLELAARLEQQRRQLLDSQRRIALHLRHTPLAVIDWDSAGQIAAWNPAAARIFGVDEADAIGADVSILGIVPHDDPKFGARLELADADGPRETTILLAHDVAGAGEPLFCEWYNTPLVDVADQTIGVASIVRDVTQDLQAERALHEAQKLESLGRLAGGLAHDFNNLLAALMGEADLALLELPSDSEIAAHLHQITAAAERAAGLTRQLLDYSGQRSYRLRPIDLNEVADDTAGVLGESLAHNVRVRSNLADRLPNINADAAQIRQIVMSLISNAAEAIADEPGEILIRTSALVLDRPILDPQLRGGPLEPGTYVRLEVIDDGRGMSPETLARIFDPFFSTKFTGRGLGLASMLGVVRGHRGALRVESTPGEGARFELLFPALDRPEPPAVANMPQPPLARRRVLVVDDEAAVRRMVSTALGTMGYEVVAAAAGDAALELFEQDREGFDLVLSDLTMPGLDGLELFSELTARDPKLPVILSSGYSRHPTTASYPDGRPVTFLSKPYRVRSLIETVNSELGARTERPRLGE